MVEVAGVPVLATVIDGADPKSLLTTLDQLKSKLGSGVVVLGTVHEDKVALIAGVTKDLTDRVRAGDVVKHVAEQTGARGGERPDMAGLAVAILPMRYLPPLSPCANSSRARWPDTTVRLLVQVRRNLGGIRRPHRSGRRPCCTPS